MSVVNVAGKKIKYDSFSQLDVAVKVNERVDILMEVYYSS